MTDFKWTTSSAIPYAGVRIVENENAVTIVDDWSECRSEARSKRRHRLGFKTRLRKRLVPTFLVMNGGRTIIAHPDLIAALKRSAKETLK